MRQLIFLLVLHLIWSVGCARKIYYYHPNKTTATMEMDYSTCMSSLGSHGRRAANISEFLEECMQSKGYEAISAEEAKERGIEIPAVWPPQAAKSSSIGP